MNTVTADLPLTQRFEPASQEEVRSLVARAGDEGAAIYPLGGEVSQDYGLPARREGWGVRLTGLNRIVDYPARDMTITVEAGVTMQTLNQSLAEQNQYLPLDVPFPEKATIGGVVATAWNGPRRFGCGAIRDFVIGIQAVDGVGRLFKGGGRVVKNVAGYDFCKLLTGSLGTLGVITQLTLRVLPQVEKSIFVTTRIADDAQAKRLLEATLETGSTPICIEILGGPEWANDAALGDSTQHETELGGFMAVGLEGQAADVDWMRRQIDERWRAIGTTDPHTLNGDEALGLWRQLAEFSSGGQAPLVLKASLAPRGAAKFVAEARAIDPRCSFQSRAEGIVIVRFSEFPAEGLSRTLVSRLQPVAAEAEGRVVLLSNPSGAEVTHQTQWGGSTPATRWMTAIKKRFDPHDLLNPGRFVYDN